MKKIKLNFLQLIIIVFIPALILSIVTGSLVYMNLNDTGKVSKTNNKHVNEFINTYNKLLDEYYEDLDESKLVDAAINGMMQYTGDDYTIHMNEDATEVLNERLEGTYEGIGISITLNENNEIYIAEVFDESPAKIAGINVGDILVSINSESLEGMTTEEASKLIKNNKETKFIVGVSRNGEILEFEVERKKLIVPAITSSIKEVMDKKIGYIYLDTFSSTVDTQVETTLLSMESELIR